MTIKKGDTTEDITSQDVPSEEKQLVDKKAYDEVARDMIKYKQVMKQQQEELKRLKEEKEALQKQDLIKNQEFQKLFETAEAELQRERSEKAAERNKFVNYHKKQAVINAVGGFKRQEYSHFINVDAIEVNDAGDIDQISLQKEVDRIRQNFPDLLLSASKQTPPANAPVPTTEITAQDWSKLNEAQRKEYRLKMLNERSKK